MQFYFKEHQHKSLPPNLQLALDSIKSKISNFLSAPGAKSCSKRDPLEMILN